MALTQRTRVGSSPCEKSAHRHIEHCRSCCHTSSKGGWKLQCWDTTFFFGVLHSSFFVRTEARTGSQASLPRTLTRAKISRERRKHEHMKSSGTARKYCSQALLVSTFPSAATKHITDFPEGQHQPPRQSGFASHFVLSRLHKDIVTFFFLRSVVQTQNLEMQCGYLHLDLPNSTSSRSTLHTQRTCTHNRRAHAQSRTPRVLCLVVVGV